MAQLKDTIVSGSLRATDTIYTTTLQTKTINALTENNSTTYGPGINGQVLKSNGTSVYWTTLGGASDYEVIDSSSARAIGTGTNLITERDVYYGLPTINDAHDYTSSTTIYAPTTKGTTAQFLRGDNTWSDTISGGILKITNNGNTVSIGSQNASFTHIYNTANVPFVFNKGILTTDAGASLGNTTFPFHNLVLGGTTNATMTAASTNPRITFQEGTGTSAARPVHIIYCDYDNYRSPAGLKVIGGSNASPAWFEVEGNIYATAFKGNADSATTARYLSGDTRLEYGWNGLNYFNISATNQSAAKVNDTPYATATWTHILRFNHGNSAGYYTDLAIPFNANSLYYKRVTNNTLNNSTTNGGWVQVLDVLNYTTTLNNTYLQLAGGTLTGAVNTANNVWNKIGDDAQLGDINKAGHIGIQGLSGNTGIFFVTYNQSSKTTGGAITWDSSKFIVSHKMMIGQWTNDSASPNVGIHIHDLRNISNSASKFGNQSVNWYFDTVNGNWVSIMSMKGWIGDYSAWEIAGNAHTTLTTNTDRYYVRSLIDVTTDGTTTTTAGDWHTLAFLPQFDAVGTDSHPVYVTAQGAITAVNLTNTANALMNALSQGNSTPVDDDYYISQYVNGGDTTKTYHRRPMSALWSYITNKYNAANTQIAGNKLEVGTNLSAATLRTSLGLSNAMHFIGVATVDITDGSTTNPSISGYNFTNKQTGDIIIDKNTRREFVWTTAGKWEMLGFDTSTAYSKTTSNNTFISSITQATDGTITAGTRALNTNTDWLGNAGTATKWKNAQTVYVNLSSPSTTTTLQGGSSTATQLGISGTLPVAHGGTGVTNTADARTLFLTATGNARVFYGTCDTADSTVAKVVTCSVYPDLQTGDILIVKFSHTNTGAVANLTLNVNNKGAKSIKKQYNNTLANLTHAGELMADTISEFIYNGQYWILANADYNNTYNYSSLQSASGASRMAENTTNGGIGLHGYTLQLMTLNQAWSSIACTNGSTANNSGTTTQKTPARADFLLDAPILYMTDNKYVAPQTESNVSGYTAYACNFLYNTSGNVTLSIQQPVYLVGILNSDKVTFKLDENQWWTQSLPTQQDPQAKSNKIYILLGLAYSATNIYLLPYHPVYYHNGIRIQLLSGSGGGTGTWIGTEAPEEESYNLWVDTDEDATGAMVLRGDAIKMLNFTIASSKWTLHDGLYVTELPFGSTFGTRASTNASYTANGINVDDVVLSLQILTNKHLIQDGTLSWETSNGSLLLKSTQQITNTITGYVVLGTSMGFVPTIVAQNPVF